MKKRLSVRMLSMLLVAALLIGMMPPVSAVSDKSSVTFTQVDNSAVSVNPLQRPDEEPNNMDTYLDTDVVRVSIVLQKASTIKAGFSTVDIAANEAAMTYRSGLKEDQDLMVNRIEKAIGCELDVVWNLTLAANLISANVRYGQIEAIRAVPGVKGVYLETQYVAEPVQSSSVSPNMATSGGQTGSSMAWAAGYTGAGTRIAVIDTGSDTDHQSLRADAYEYALAKLAEDKGVSAESYIESLDLLDAEEIAAVADKLNVSIDADQAYFNSKIPFGYNYKDADYDITHDNDEQGEHGSHVAGIATANSYIADGQGFVKALETVYVQGVAPEAQLLTMKVFGKTGSPYDADYMAAIEDAVILGADAVNLSLGSIAPGRGTHDNPVMEQIMDDLTGSGVVVAISAGNSGAWAETAENGGYLYATDVSLHTVGQPGSFTHSLAVASVENDGMVGYYFTVGGEMIVYNEDNNDGAFTNKLFREIAGEHEYVFIDGVGKAEDWQAVADVLPGKIAFCSRGETNFVEKATLAIDAGAIAVFIYNNQSGMITLDLTDYTYTNPVAALSQVQGTTVRANSTPVTDANGNVKYLTGKLTISDTIGLGQFDSAYDTMSSFSSWGVPGSLEMKPEITAPGGNIYSLNGLQADGKGYEIMSGTSMASPQVAGMAALMAQYVRENNMTEKTGLTERQLIQSLLMSTAEPVLASEGVYYPILQQGAGLANVYDAMSAKSFITMAPGSSSGDADGKVKVELFDDPDRTGSYSASFTVHNLDDEAKTLSLNADFFTQALISDGAHDYMDYATAMLGMDVVWTVDGSRARTVRMDGHDFNGDGQVNTADGQALLDYATGVRETLSDMDKADLDGDGDVDSHDAYVFLRSLSTTTAILPANGSVDLTVRFSLTDDARAKLEAEFPNGNYIQGFLFAEVEGDVAHSIPVLGFYGNWTDPSMFDVGRWVTYATKEDTRIPYIGRTRGNDYKVVYDWDPGYNYSFGGNPLVTDSKYMPERDAMNSADALDGVSFIAIRHADQSRVVINNETSGENIMDVQTGAVNMAYYYGALGWQNSGMTLSTNFSLNDTAEDDVISVAFTLVPEYYIDEDGNVNYEALGDGATISTSFVIDNTAPEIFGVSIDLLTNSMTVKASDNNYIAAVGLYNKTGTRCLAQTGAKQEIEKGEIAEYSFSLDKVNGKKFLLQVFDYAMNRSTYLIEMQIGEQTDLPEMMAYDLADRHWCSFDKNFVYDYKVGTHRIAYADHIFYAATIAEHYAFASTNNGDLYVMPEDDLTDTTFITNVGEILYDMAYSTLDGEIYAVNDQNELFTLHKLTGELTYVGEIGLNTNTLAVDGENTFYCNELGTGKVYSFTLDTMDEPELLMNDPFLTAGDPITGADMGGSTGNMGMEYNPNTGMLCWNSHCEVLVGSYITFAYYYEIDPKTGEFTRYEDFWHEMSGLMIPDRTGRGSGWADPTDKIIAVKLNKSEIDVIRDTTAQLTANVQPWTATDRTVTWTSSDESIATVDKNGVVTGHKEGTAIIRATSNLDPDFYGECTVNVEILDVTVHGTLSDENGDTMFYDWDMSTGESWQAGNPIELGMTSATYSSLEDVYYMMDNISGQWQMHKVSDEGEILASAANTNAIPLWDMAYNEYFSELRQKEQVSSIYYYYLLSPKDPMALDSVGFNLGDLASYLVGITSAGYEQMIGEDGDLLDTEHLILLDNDGYIWDFWVYDMPDGRMNAMYAISKSNLPCEFPGDDTMDNMYTSLMLGEDGNLYLSTFNGSTNELWHLSYDQDIEEYVAVMLGTVGDKVWPATITSVSVNSAAVAETASPEPMGTMAAETISANALASASVSDRASKATLAVSPAELAYKQNAVTTNAAGTKDDPIVLVEGDNSGTAPTTGSDKYCYFTYTAQKDGTVTVTSAGTDWRANYFVNGEQQNTNLINPKYDGSTITCDLTAGDTFLLMISPYISWSYGGDITVNFHFSGEGETPDPTPDPEPDPEPNTGLSLGENSLVSGTKYTYTAAADGRLEFDFTSLKGSDGKTIYQYTYGKADRVKILINGEYAANLENTKITVKTGDVMTVELVPVDADSYTVNLNLTALEPAKVLVLGDNDIARNTDYAYVAEQDGTLYTTIKELWCDDTYCSEASLSSSVVFKINGTAVYGFNNSYEVKTGDEITVTLGTQFGESAKAVFTLSYEGFYQHPIGTRGNPYTLSYAQCPADSAAIPADSAVWYKLIGFGSGYNLVVKGENAYVILGDTQVNAVNGELTVPASTNVQIGNAGSEAAVFTLDATITEGYPDNPKDLAEGKNTVTIGKSKNYYYDFVAETDGTATFTVSGENWRFHYSLLAADGSYLIQDEDHQAKREDEATVTVDLTAGQSIVLKLGTLNASWTAPGGELTVDFHFEADEVVTPENPLTLGKNTLNSGTLYGYVVPADCRMEFKVNSVMKSDGSKLYSWLNGSNVLIQVDGVAMTADAKRMNVKAGQVITVQPVSVDEDTYTVEMTLSELDAAVALSLGENDIAQNLEHVYTAERDGTVYFSIVELLYNDAPAVESDLGSSILLTINGKSVYEFDKAYEVKSGDEIAIILKDYSWDGSGKVSAVINLSYEGFYEHPLGSIANPVELLYADCPTKTVEIAASSAVWYQLEGDPGDFMTPSNYPFEDKYLVITGEDAYVIVDGTRTDAVDGVVKVLMDDTTLIQIGNDGSASASFDISVEIPEGHPDNPQDLAEGDNKITLPSYASHYFDFTAAKNGTATVKVSGENWKYTFTHYAADGTKVSSADYYAKNGDTDTVTLAMKAGERIVVQVGTSQGWSQPGGDITVNFHFEPDAGAECTHPNTEIRDAKEASCTEEGYTGDTYCVDCGELLTKGAVIPMLEHDYQNGSCANCGEADPNYKPTTVTVDVVNDVAVTNGVVEVRWDHSKLTLTDIVIHADYTSMLDGEGCLTFGYVALNGIAAGKSVATLTFETQDPEDADVSILVKERNNENGETTVNPFVDVAQGSYYYNSVLWAVENGITTGVDDTHFAPELDCDRASAVTFLWRAAGSPEPVSKDNPFVDVSTARYYYKAVLWAVENGITTGVDADHFAPDQVCSRGEIVTFLWRAMGKPEATGENPFTDLRADAFYVDAVLWAAEQEIAKGVTGTTFAPDAICNRAQVVTFLYRAYA